MNSLQQYWADKQASLTTDYLGEVVSPRFLHGVGGLEAVGAMHGMAEDDLTIPSDAKGIVPGIGSSRLLRRARRVRKELGPKSSGTRARVFSDRVAPLTNVLLLAAAGAALGGRYKDTLNRDIREAAPSLYNQHMTDAQKTMIGRSRGATMGGGIGVALGLAGALAAALTRKRTKKEQADVEGSTAHAVLNHLVPGKGSYDWHKRLGASTYFEEPQRGK